MYSGGGATPTAFGRGSCDIMPGVQVDSISDSELDEPGERRR